MFCKFGSLFYYLLRYYFLYICKFDICLFVFYFGELRVILLMLYIYKGILFWNKFLFGVVLFLGSRKFRVYKFDKLEFNF